MYRSTSKEFTINASTRIQTINVGPDEEYSFTHDLYGSDCGKSYYAVRAFDDAGNYSGVRVEEVEDIVIKEIVIEKSTGSSEETGEVIAVPIVTEAGLIPESEVSPGGEVVLGKETEEDGTEGTAEETEILGAENGGFPWVWLFLAILIGGFIGTQLRKKTKNDQPFNQSN